MASKKLERIIQNYLDEKISDKDLSLLIDRFTDEELKEQLKKFIEIDYLLSRKYTVVDSKAAYLNFLSHTSHKKNLELQQSKKKRFMPLKYAALFIGLLGLAYIFRHQIVGDRQTPVLQIADKAITLQMNNGKVKEIDSGGEIQVVGEKGQVVATQRGNKIVYRKNPEIGKLTYNELHIPYGKRFQIELSDGTVVDLNSGSSLRYPVNFPKEGNRLVYVQGEAYFKVAKDTDHPFIVNAREVDIRVTGTEFNISCYPEDIVINTVLVEGSVQLRNHKDLYGTEPVIKIVPGEMASWYGSDGKINVLKVDTETYTAWKDGVLIFRHMKFEDILKKLERHYNVIIKNNNHILDDRIYTARFENSSLEHVMASFNEHYAIHYTIYKNHIEINK